MTASAAGHPALAVQPVLAVDHLGVHYGDTIALHDVTF